ncbi:MAG: tRNA (adenosine(37)-N6)-threonylcarbamoyltransferase complex dimerization subunit type 1 TsaB [Chloroflexi bacterium]|nr:tRNA (adenosine(37)-N6)-threonylcarbamoyltransferase complex dimerization subunit type 1 TsaB [Chloroflexota bacterium]
MLLAVDTSTARAGLALYDGQVQLEFVWWAGRDHGRHLIPSIRDALARLGKSPADLTAVAAARGPGSYTGLRVGLAAARGLAFALGVPSFGIGSLEVLANGLPPLGKPIRAVLEAGRGRVATAAFSWDGSAYRQEGAIAGVTLDELISLIDAPCAVVGDVPAGARERLRAMDGVWVAPPALCVRRPAVLAEHAWHRLQRGDLATSAEAEPIYLTPA